MQTQSLVYPQCGHRFTADHWVLRARGHCMTVCFITWEVWRHHSCWCPFTPLALWWGQHCTYTRTDTMRQGHCQSWALPATLPPRLQDWRLQCCGQMAPAWLGCDCRMPCLDLRSLTCWLSTICGPASLSCTAGYNFGMMLRMQLPDTGLNQLQQPWAVTNCLGIWQYYVICLHGGLVLVEIAIWCKYDHAWMEQQQCMPSANVISSASAVHCVVLIAGCPEHDRVAPWHRLPCTCGTCCPVHASHATSRH